MMVFDPARCGRAALNPHHEWPGHPGPATWGGHPRCQPASRAGMRPPPLGGGNEAPFEEHDDRTDPSGAPERRPAARLRCLASGCPWAVGSSSRSPPSRPFALEGGGIVATSSSPTRPGVSSTPTASNAVLVCHALTGDTHAAGPPGPGHPTAGWWEELIGPGARSTPTGSSSCASTCSAGVRARTGPASIDPATGRPYASTFPVVTIRDMVRVQAAVGRPSRCRVAGSPSWAGRWAACR